MRSVVKQNDRRNVARCNSCGCVFVHTRVTHTRDRRERRAVDVVLVRQVVRTERHAAVSRYRERTGPSSLLRVIGVTRRPTACLGLEEAKVERA